MKIKKQIDINLLQKQIPYRNYSIQYKTIRNSKDNHLGNYILALNTNTKSKVIIKKHMYSSQQQLNIILQDYSKLNNMHQQTLTLTKFVGYSYQNFNNSNYINLIYQYGNSLQQQIQNIQLKNNDFKQIQLQKFTKCMLQALTVLQKYQLSHLCIKPSLIHISNRDTLNLSFSLFFTPYLTGSIQQLLSNKKNIANQIQNYNLSQYQLQLLPQKDQLVLQKINKIKSDKQSLGILLLRLGTKQCRSKIYQIKNDQICWNQQGMKKRLQIFNNKFNQNLCKKMQYLIFNDQFISFMKMPQFMYIYEFNNNLSSQKSYGVNSRNSRYTQSNQKKLKQSRYNGCYSSNKSNNNSFLINSGIKSTSKKILTQQKQISKQFSIEINKSNSSKKDKLKKKIIYQSPNKSTPSKIKNVYLFQSSNKRNSFQLSFPQNSNKKQQNQTKNNSFHQLNSLNSPQKLKAQKYGQLKFKIQQWILPQIGKRGINLKLPDNTQYFGQLKQNNRQGKGILYFPQGDIYAGQWKQDNMNGQGWYLFINCDMYKGFVKQGLKHGQGQYIYSDGGKYIGGWKNDLKHGYGKLQMINNQKYQGYWQNGLKSGEGKYTNSEGDLFVGIFHNNKKNGRGQLIKYNGIIINGRWQNDTLIDKALIKFTNGINIQCPVSQLNGKLIITGQAQQISSDGTKFKGTYKANTRTGQCVIQFSNGDIYKGFLQDSLMHVSSLHPKSKYIFKNGWQFSGTLNKNKIQGFSNFKQKNGIEIQCQFNQGKILPNNKSKITYQNGDVYIGQISKLGRNGKGIYIQKNGKVIQGIFLANKLKQIISIQQKA